MISILCAIAAVVALLASDASDWRHNRGADVCITLFWVFITAAILGAN